MQSFASPITISLPGHAIRHQRHTHKHNIQHNTNRNGIEMIGATKPMDRTKAQHWNFAKLRTARTSSRVHPYDATSWVESRQNCIHCAVCRLSSCRYAMMICPQYPTIVATSQLTAGKVMAGNCFHLCSNTAASIALHSTSIDFHAFLLQQGGTSQLRTAGGEVLPGTWKINFDLHKVGGFSEKFRALQHLPLDPFFRFLQAQTKDVHGISALSRHSTKASGSFGLAANLALQRSDIRVTNSDTSTVHLFQKTGLCDHLVLGQLGKPIT